MGVNLSLKRLRYMPKVTQKTSILLYHYKVSDPSKREIRLKSEFRTARNLNLPQAI